MNRNFRHRLLQQIFWSAPAQPLVRLVEAFIRRWHYVVLNRSLHSDTNGERWLVSLLPPHAQVLDVGFNTGEFTRSVLAQRPDARVIGFDPARAMQQHFSRTFQDVPGVQFEPIGLSHTAGTATFFDTGSMSSSLADRGNEGTASATTYPVVIDTLDHYSSAHALGRIDLLKIDAEGYDLNVLEGATELLAAQAIDLFMFEYADGWISNRRTLAQAVAFIERHPYRLFRLFNGFLVPLQYSPRDERFDLGCMIVGVSLRRLASAPPPIRRIVT